MTRRTRIKRVHSSQQILAQEGAGDAIDETLGKKDFAGEVGLVLHEEQRGREPPSSACGWGAARTASAELTAATTSSGDQLALHRAPAVDRARSADLMAVLTQHRANFGHPLPVGAEQQDV